MDKELILKIWVSDRPGVLDRITTVIRRKRWNICSLTAGDVGEGLSQINIVIKGRTVDLKVLGAELDRLEGIRSWEECTPTSHVLRETIMFRMRKDIHTLPEQEGLRIIDKRGNLLFAEYTGTPQEVDKILKTMRGQMVSCVRTGPLALAIQEDGE